MIAKLCPATEELQDYLKGELPSDSSGEVDEHLSDCARCQAALETLDQGQDDSWKHLFRSLPAALTGPDPLLRQMLLRAKSIRSDDTPLLESVAPGPVAVKPPVAAQAFLDSLRQIQLLTATDIEAFLQALPPELDRSRTDLLAEALVHQGKLTEYQAAEAMRGRAGQLVLGNYLLLSPIAGGGMGRVFRALHRRMRRVVAVKLLPPEVVPAGESQARFQREIEAAAHLSHPNIVTAHDAGEDQGRPFLVMEYVEGQDLARLVRSRGALSVSEAVAYTLQAARGLAHAHRAGIIHRDVKPGNLLVEASGTVKVTDLGLARILQPDRSEGAVDLTSRDAVMGTAAYMAPEQAFHSHQADGRADVYSLGCTLYYLLTGAPPFQGATALETILAHRDQPIPSLAAARPDCPAALATVVVRMLAKNPEERYTSMTAVIAALEQVSGQAVTQTLVDAAPVVQPSGPAHSPARGRRRWLLPVAASAAAAVLLVGLLAHFAWFPPEDHSSGIATNEGKNRPSPEVPTGQNSPAPDKTSNVLRTAAPGIELVMLQPGEFWMGARDSDVIAPKPAPRFAPEDEKPRHKVHLTNPFYFGKSPITQRQYYLVMGHNPSPFREGGDMARQVQGQDTSDHPVSGLRWIDAVLFCNRLSEMHGLKPYYQVDKNGVVPLGGTGYRLPTEAEWEYAARGGTDTMWSFGDDASKLGDYAWYAGNSKGATHPVGLKKPNPFGLYDMHGNLATWCWDRYDAKYYESSKAFNPPGPGSGETRVYRGGSWDYNPAQSRSSARHNLGARVTGGYGVLTLVGLRIARNAE
jgi:serine/threonine protein kinase